MRLILDFYRGSPDTPPHARADAGHLRMRESRLAVWRVNCMRGKARQCLLMNRTHAIDWTGFDRNNDRLTGTNRRGAARC
jgi:hypothetical protein